MKKKLFLFAATAILSFASVTAMADSLEVTDNKFPVQLNGNGVEINGYNIDGNTYFKLRDVASVVGNFNVDFKNDNILLSDGKYNGNEEETRITYFNESYNFEYSIPSSWETKAYWRTEYNPSYGVLERTDYYEKQNYFDSYYDYFGDGLLFSLYVCEADKVDEDLFVYGDNLRILGEKDGIILFTVIPTDVPSAVEYIKDWASMIEEYDSIVNSFKWKTLEEKYTAYVNPYPVLLNGEKAEIEGYNIDGNTYFKLRDIAAVVGGFEVDFNNNVIQLSKDGYRYAETDMQKYIGVYGVERNGYYYGLTISEINENNVVFYCDEISITRIYNKGPFNAALYGNYAVGTGDDLYYGEDCIYSLTFSGDEILMKCEDYEGYEPVVFNINTDRTGETVKEYVDLRNETYGE